MVHVIDTVLVPAFPTPVPPPSIYQTAASVPGLSTLTTLVSLAGLATTLNTTGSTSYTVLAPSNTAFAALPSALVDWLTNAKATNRAALSSTLLYHVLGAAVPSSAVPAAPGIRFFPTLCGTNCTPVLNATNSSNAIVLRNALLSVATVAIPNVVCSNGIVHVVDSVLLPNNTAGFPTLDVVQTANATPALSNLTAALVATGLTTLLTMNLTSPPFTVFAPVNTAFAVVPASISGNPTVLTSVLQYHVIAGRVYSGGLLDGVAVVMPTLNGQNLTITRNGAIVTVRGAGSTATVTAADIDSTK